MGYIEVSAQAENNNHDYNLAITLAHFFFETDKLKMNTSYIKS